MELGVGFGTNHDGEDMISEAEHHKQEEERMIQYALYNHYHSATTKGDNLGSASMP